MSLNLAKLLEGPAVVSIYGALLHFKGGLNLAPTADVFALESDPYGIIGQRASENAIALTGTPVGVWTQAQLDALYRWQNPTPGQLLTPRYDVSAITPADNTITLLGATTGELVRLQYPRKGCPVRLYADTTMAAPLVAGTLYYYGIPNAAQPWIGTLHASEAAAVAGTGAIDITDTGAGDHYLIEQEPLIVHTYANRKITFHNGAVAQMPPVVHTATGTLIGQVGFGAFRINNTAWSGANSLYTVERALLTDVPPDPANIKTQEYTGTWGAAPWDSFKFHGPATVTPSLTTDPVSTDGDGQLALKIASVGVQATGIPAGFTEAQMLDVLGMQGGAVARGASRVRADLVLSATGVHTTVYNAAATALPQTFAATGRRAGELAWASARTPGSPAFRVGVAGPA